VAQGPAQAEPLGDGPLGRQGGRGRLQPGPLSAAVEGQEVVLQQGIVELQLALLGQQGPQAELKLALQDRGQLLQQLVEAEGFGPGGLQIPLQAPQGGRWRGFGGRLGVGLGGGSNQPQGPLAGLGLGRLGLGKPVSCRHQRSSQGPLGAPT
jgi:hypothetical protein